MNQRNQPLGSGGGILHVELRKDNLKDPNPNYKNTRSCLEASSSKHLSPCCMLMEMNQWNQTADSLGILALATVVDYSNTAECLAIAVRISS